MSIVLIGEMDPLVLHNLLMIEVWQASDEAVQEFLLAFLLIVNTSRSDPDSSRPSIIMLYIARENSRSVSNAHKDSSYLDIQDIKVDGKAAQWEFAPRVEALGSPLTVSLLPEPSDRDQEIDMDISLSTTKDCTALQWLTANQTSNKRHPYMFSQCQAIHARSI